MNFREFMRNSGYELKTTFWNDFSIADKFGCDSVKDTYQRAFSEWKGNYVFLTELTLVLNHKIWQHHKTNPKLAQLYDDLWRKTDAWAMDNLKGDELDYFIDTLD